MPAKLQRAARVGLGAAAIGAAVLAAFLAWQTYRTQTNVFFPERRRPSLDLARSGIPRARALTFGAGGLTLHGWHAPSTNRAAVVLLHGAGGDRASLSSEAQTLARAGFGVLSFDGPGHGDSGGHVTWSDVECTALRAALDFVVRQPDVDPERVGAYGFSLGGYVLSQVAASDRRIRAAVFAGTPADPVAQARWQHRRFWLFSQLPALFALRQGGMNLDLRARDLVGRIAPRPVLFITGTADTTVPRSMADELYAAAREPKELYVVDGAGHGDYASVAPAAFAARLLSFFEHNL